MTSSYTCRNCGQPWHGSSPCRPPYPYPYVPYAPQPYPQSPEKPSGRQGWVCPALWHGNAPWKAQCGCQGRTEAVTATSTVTFNGLSVGPSYYPCHCCLIPAQSRVEVMIEDCPAKYLVCATCHRHCKNHFDPDWHTHDDLGRPFGPTTKVGVEILLRRYRFLGGSMDGNTYYNDEDPDDYK